MDGIPAGLTHKFMNWSILLLQWTGHKTHVRCLINANWANEWIKNRWTIRDQNETDDYVLNFFQGPKEKKQKLVARLFQSEKSCLFSLINNVCSLDSIQISHNNSSVKEHQL